MGQAQVPPLHEVPAPHAAPQLPQCCGLVVTFTQLELHWVRPVAQPLAQTPAEHTWPAPHALPQLPQFTPSPVVSAQPLEQAVSPAWQAHAPAVQAWPAAHALPHDPQFDASACGSTQLPPQVTNPAAHAGPAPALAPPLPDTAPFPPAPPVALVLPLVLPPRLTTEPPTPPFAPTLPPEPPAPPFSSGTAGSLLTHAAASRNEREKARAGLKVRRRIGSTKGVDGTVAPRNRADSILYPAASKAGRVLSG
jgi:WAS/WASL-interacting protein